MRDWAALMAATLLSSCATPRSRPGDMSASDHERRAGWVERMAAARGPGKDAEQTSFLERLAEDHRRAARALREAEAMACGGLAAEERAADPFRPSQVISVEPLGGAASPASARPDLRGALVRLRPADGDSPEALKTRIECALAHNATVGAGRAGPGVSPFSVYGVTVLVRAEPDGPIVELRTEDQRNAEVLLEALRRFGTRG